MYESCRVAEPYIALTFDDGPTPDLTPRLLDILKAENVRATLFVIGKRVADHPELVRRAAAEGHEIGNHTWKHPHLTQLDRTAAAIQIAQTSEAIAQSTGRPPALFRPPYIDTTDELNRWIQQNFGLKVISASVDSADWRDRNADLARKNILEKVAPGAIILCHETQPTTIDALPGILHELKARGYRFVTVSELLGLEKASSPKE